MLFSRRFSRTCLEGISFKFFCMFYLQCITRKCAKEKKLWYPMLYQSGVRRPVYFKSIVMSSYMKSVIHSFQISKLSVVLLTEPTNNKTHQIIENTRIGQREIKMQKQIWIFQVWSISKRGPLQFISLFYDLKAKLTAFFSSLYQA